MNLDEFKEKTVGSPCVKCKEIIKAEELERVSLQRNYFLTLTDGVWFTEEPYHMKCLPIN